LSGGQQQRIAFARVVVLKPQLVLFDEQLSALYAILREEMRIEIINLVRNIGLTAIYVTHDQSEALVMSDEIVVKNKGEEKYINSIEYNEYDLLIQLCDSLVLSEGSRFLFQN